MGKTKRKVPRSMAGPKPAGKNDMMKQIQQMQAEMQKAQEALDEQLIIGTAGGGAVKVECNGSKVLSKVTINPDVIDEDDVEMLEDLIVAAVNDALSKVDEVAGSAMSQLTGGLSIPGLM